MNLRKISWLMALIVTLGLAFGSVGSVAAAPTGDHLPQTKEPTSARFDFTGGITISGNGLDSTIPFSGKGAISGTDFMLDMEVSAPAGESGPDKLTVSMVVVGDKAYYKMTGISPETDDKWYVSDYAGTTGMDAMTGVDLQAIDDAITVKGTAKETINGAATTRYDLDVDPNKVLEATTPEEESLPPVGLGDSEATMSIMLWVGDADMYVHRMSLLTESTSDLGDSSLTLRVELDMTFSDFDTPITITPPANAEPLDLGLGGEIAGMPVGGILGGMPGMTTGMGTGMPETGSGADGSPWTWTLLALGVAMLTGGVALRKHSSRAQEAAKYV